MFHHFCSFSVCVCVFSLIFRMRFMGLELVSICQGEIFTTHEALGPSWG